MSEATVISRSCMAPRRGVMRRLASSMVTFMLVGVLAIPANADPYGTGVPGTGRIPETTTVRYCIESGMSNPFINAYNGSAVYIYNNTRYSTTRICTNHTLLAIIDNIPGYRGWYNCDTVGTLGRCAFATIALNSQLLTNDINRRKTACHEWGHHLGLTHHDSGSWGCMINGAVTQATQTYVLHHRNHIQAGVVTLE